MFAGGGGGGILRVGGDLTTSVERVKGNGFVREYLEMAGIWPAGVGEWNV